jgi:hypothetical protein
LRGNLTAQQAAALVLDAQNAGLGGAEIENS